MFFLEIALEGTYGICAMGINIADMDTPSFVFSTNDIIEMVLDEEKSLLTISRRNGFEKTEFYLEGGPE